jgi:Ser-tRNA(Ala) deacylase AlaX
METKILFLDDPYQSGGDAKVLKVEDNKVWLDQTIFYAFSGGQASDTGMIDKNKVKDVQKQDKTIVHIMEDKPSFQEGDMVEMKLDWDRRFNLMRLHSAAHIVHKIFADKTGIKKLIGSNISPEKARLDYAYEENINSFLPEIEKEVNELIEKQIDIKTFPDEDNPEKRWWQLNSYEDWKMPCGGTHVRNTREIGVINLKRKNIGAAKERIEITLV